MSDNAFQDFRLFPAISEAWELTRSGLVIIREELYKLELWHSYSNPDIPYYVSISVQKNGTWTRMPDPPFATGRDGDRGAARRHGIFDGAAGRVIAKLSNDYFEEPCCRLARRSRHGDGDYNFGDCGIIGAVRQKPVG